MASYRIERYLTAVGGRDPFGEWLDHLRDNCAKVAVLRRINRISQGNLGDHRFCRDGVWEIRVDTGTGYRVYYGKSGQQIVLLLCGGDKRTQTADIERAVHYWRDWQRRGNDEKSIT